MDAVRAIFRLAVLFFLPVYTQVLSFFHFAVKIDMHDE